jgi:hypothetical protein
MGVVSYSVRTRLSILIVLGFKGRRRTGVVLFGWTAIWERCPEFEWLIGISRESLPQGIDLSLNFRKWPCLGTLFQDTHMPSKVITCICIEFGVWRCYGDL